MRRLAVLILVLLFLLIPTGIAYGACNSTDTLDQEVDQGIPVLVVEADGNPLGCGRLVPRKGATPRQYDPSTGSFTSTDPVEWPVGKPYMNAYQYGFNNPLVYTDPSGAWPGEGAAKWVGGAIADGAGAACSASAYCQAAAVGVQVGQAQVEYTQQMYNDHGWLGAVNAFNPAYPLLVHGDQCINGSWGAASKPRSDAAMVAAEQQGDGNHCWQAGAAAVGTAGTAFGGGAIAGRLGSGVGATGVGAGARGVSVTFGQGGHGARHLPGGLSEDAVESAIKAEVNRVSTASSPSGNWYGHVKVDGKVIQYRASPRPDGSVHVGTYYPPKSGYDPIG